MKADKSVVKVFRYDPSADAAPRYEVYEVPLELGNVLYALLYIREKYDSSLAFRFSCRERRCGVCAVSINGDPRLACKAPLEREITVEPLRNFNVIRDLVVDKAAIDREISKARPYLQRLSQPRTEVEPIEQSLFQKYSELANCFECLSCLSVCPVFEVAPSDFAGPLILLKIARRMHDPRDEADREKQAVFEGLYHCSLCRKCDEICPKGIRVSRLVIQGSYQCISKEKVGPHPSQIELAKTVSETGRILKPLQAPLLEKMHGVISVEEPIRRVGLFLGCYFNSTFQRVGRATIDVLRKNQIEVVLPPSQVCCGMPLIWSGQEKELVREDLIQNVQAFENESLETVLTICPSCGMTWNEDLIPMYKEVIGREPNFKVLDIHKFLAEEIKLNTSDMGPISTSVTYHDPCHLKRGMGVYDEPRELIQGIPKLTFREMECSDQCCGGYLRHINLDIANRIRLKKMEKAMQTKASVLATTCPMCILNMWGVARNKHMKVKSVLELLADAYKAKENG